MSSFKLSLVVGLLLVASCNRNSEPLRTWKPSDHVQPVQVEQESAQAMPEDHGVSAGAEVWMMHCASCHGASANGQGQMMQVPFNFSENAWQKKFNDQQLADVIRSGRNKMPAFAEVLGDMEILALVKFIRAQGEHL